LVELFRKRSEGEILAKESIKKFIKGDGKRFVKELLKGLMVISALAMTVYAYSITSHATEAETILGNNPYITYSPDGNAFTVGYKDTTAEVYDHSQKGYTHMQLGITGPEETDLGEHYYKGLYKGAVPVAFWKMNYPRGRCMHSSSSVDITAGRLDLMGATKTNCHGIYNAGWNAYCAICGEPITPVYFYMTEDMASTITYLPSGVKGSNYFYLCPYDNSLENYYSTDHECILVSANRYKIEYDANSDDASGNMPTQYFYYDNAEVYEGETIVCLPHRLIITIISKEGSETDAISQ